MNDEMLIDTSDDVREEEKPTDSIGPSALDKIHSEFCHDRRVAN